MRMGKFLSDSLAAFAVFWLGLFLSEAVAAPTAEDLLAQINELPPTERQASLEEGAKKEGSVVWYAAMNRAKLNEIVNAFQAQYPFIKVDLITGSGRRFIPRVLAEHAAGKSIYDLMNTGSMYLQTLIKAKAIMRNRTPHRKFLRDGFYDHEGYFNGIFSTPLVFVYNTTLVSPEEAPRTIEDLLHARWKGKLAMDENSYEWLMPILDYYGEERGKEIARKLGDQKLNVRRGHTLLTQLVAAGEFSVQIDAHHHSAKTTKEAGAPVEYILPKPFVPVKIPVTIYFSSHSPHPHAGTLLVDFLLSKRGQEIMVGHGRWVSRKDAEDPDNIAEHNPVIPSPVKWGDRLNEIIKLSETLLLQK